MQTLSIRDTLLDEGKAEDRRLEAIDRFDVLDTPREEGFDGIARLIRNIFKVRIGFVSVIDAHRQWFKSSEGLGISEIARSDTMCDYTIREAKPLVVTDTLLDARFSKHPAVVGEPHVRFYAGVPLRTRDGQTIGTMCAVDFEPRQFGRDQVEILTDLARVAMAEFELRQLVAVDGLTGILSRRAFKDESAKALALARRHELDVSCITFDLDHLKLINEHHGQAAGDLVLAGVARACRQILRRTDHFGRLGGEEFAVFLPHTDKQGALDVAQKLRTAVESLALDVGNATLRVTASFGIATLDAETEDLDALLSRADSALYEAKAAGRNSCVVWKRGDSGERSVQRRVLKAGRITFHNRMSTIDCTIRSLGDEGAGLDVSSTIGVPEHFTLEIRADGVEMPCRVISRMERHIEVEFD